MLENHSTKSKSLKGLELLSKKFHHDQVKLPILELILQKFTSELANKLRTIVQGTVEINSKNFQSIKCQKFFEKLDKFYTILLFQAIEWNTSGILLFDNKTILSFLNIVLGGKKYPKSPHHKWEQKNLTPIEQNISKLLGEIILETLSKSFKEITVTNFQIYNVENNYKFLNLFGPEEFGVLMSLDITIEHFIADSFHILFPYKSLEPVKDQLQKNFLSSKNIAIEDKIKLNKIISSLEVKLDCKIHSNKKKLYEIANLKPKDLIILDQNKNDNLELSYKNFKISSGKLGKIGKNFALKLTL